MARSRLASPFRLLLRESYASRRQWIEALKLLEFQHYSITVMRPWPEPLAWRRTTLKPFRPVRPKIVLMPSVRNEALPETSIEAREGKSLSLFMVPVPGDAAAALAMFPQRQWHIMALLARCPGGLDLVHANPALAFALASSWVFRANPVRQPLRSARALLSKRQVEICDWLGFPAQPSAVRALRKLRTNHVSIRTLLNLRDVLYDEGAMDFLCHCPSFTELAIWIAVNPTYRGRVAPRFLLELVAKEAEQTADSVSLWTAVRWLFSRAGLRIVPRRVLQSASQALAAHEEYSGVADHGANLCSPELVLPPPQLAASQTIVPLQTGADLLEKACTMRHCVATLRASALAGRAGSIACWRCNAQRFRSSARTARAPWRTAGRQERARFAGDVCSRVCLAVG